MLMCIIRHLFLVLGKEEIFDRGRHGKYIKSSYLDRDEGEGNT